MKFEVRGTIIPNDDKWFYDWFGMDSTAPNDILLPETGEPLEIIINSGGGDVFSGSEIYSKLKEYDGEITVKIVGIAASAASVIAMAGDTIKISPTAQLMIHNVSSVASGDHNVLKHEGEVLENYNKSIASAYCDKTDIEISEILELMNYEKWFTAEQAVEKGFADEIMFAEKQTPQLIASRTPVIPHETIQNLSDKLKPKFDIDELADKVAEKLNKKNKEPEPQKNTGLTRFFF